MKGGWLVGVVAVVVLAYITINSLTTEGVGSQGLERGTRLPPFAMPLAASAREGDANIFPGPGKGPDGEPPACSVRGPDVLNVCELSERGPVVLAFVVTRSGDCARQVDVVDRVAARVRGVAFAAVAVREDRDRLRRLIRERGWRVPVGYDHDGAVANLYGLGVVCPLLTFAGRDGHVAGTELGFVDEPELEKAARALATGRPLPDLATAGPPALVGGRHPARVGRRAPPSVMTDDLRLAAVTIDPRIADEHPGLRVWTARVDARPGRTPPELRERLRLVADRLRGPQAVALRSRPVPWAYRVLYRHLGLDPDVTRTPLEALVVDRLLHGGFSTHGLPDDALALATLETGVPVYAADADRVGALRLAPAEDGRLTLADDAGPVAVLFEPPSPDRAPGRDTRALTLIAIQAPGVEDMYVEEAVWTAASAIHTMDAES